MKIEKISLNSFKESEILKFTSDRLQKNPDRTFELYDNMFLITNNSIECGFFNLKQNITKLSLKLFLKHEIPNFAELKNFINQEFQDSEIKYIIINLYKNSLNVFNNFKSFDTMLQYERKQNLNIESVNLYSDFEVITNINDYKELAEFFEFVFEEDEEYCKSNWKKIINYYSESNLPKIEYLLKRNDEIIGAIIGLKTPQNKYFIHTIGVKSEYRGKKIGKKLIAEFLKQTNNLITYLHVFESAKIPRKLYESFGFEFQKTSSIYCKIRDW